MAGIKLIKLEPCPSPTNTITSHRATNAASSPYKCDIKISHPMSWALESYMYEKQTMIYRNKSVKSTSKSAIMAAAAAAASAGGLTSMAPRLNVVPSMRRLKRENVTNSDMIYDGNETKPWICRMCKRKYKWKNSLNCHLKNECGKPPKFYCERMCGYKTNINSNLKRHMNSNCRPHFLNNMIDIDGAGNLV